MNNLRLRNCNNLIELTRRVSSFVGIDLKRIPKPENVAKLAVKFRLQTLLSVRHMLGRLCTSQTFLWNGGLYEHSSDSRVIIQNFTCP